MPPFDPTAGGVRLTVQVQPRASRTEVVGLHGDALRIRLSAPPVDGAANDALVRYLAERLGLSRSAVTVVSGLSTRRKVVVLEGVTPEEARQLLLIGGRAPI